MLFVLRNHLETCVRLDPSYIQLVEYVRLCGSERKGVVHHAPVDVLFRYLGLLDWRVCPYIFHFSILSSEYQMPRNSKSKMTRYFHFVCMPFHVCSSEAPYTRVQRRPFSLMLFVLFHWKIPNPPKIAPLYNSRYQSRELLLKMFSNSWASV